MEANDFVNKLKASGAESDWIDLKEIYVDYKNIISKLRTKDRSAFSLNVLCILCRNIDKVPTWRDCIENKTLLTLSIDCVREMRVSERPDCIKTLACIYHIHKHIVKQNSSLPPELVLKISFMPFESDAKSLLHEYAKTYWNILADRITYLEKLKTNHMQIIKLLPKLIEDILKVIQIYDTVPFCMNILTFTIKKLHYLYSDRYSKEINEAFGQIFESITKKGDLKAFQSLKSSEALELYVKFSDCFYVIVENSLKSNFNDNVLNIAVRSCMILLRQHSDLVHCLQTFYLNSFCFILTDKCNSVFLEPILNDLLVSCEMSEKLGYEKAMKATYPFVNQLFRIYIEYMANNSEAINWKDNFTDALQEISLKLIELLIRKLKYTNQMLKCDNCHVKSGLHDALRLSFLIKHFVTISLNQKISLTKILPIYYKIILRQHNVLTELRTLGCVNYEKCYRKLQTDIHNTAISLNKAQYFDYSIKLFTVYLKNEMIHFKTEIELKNISRALYNKSICELDDKQFENALIDAFLSLIFALPESLSSDKYMSLVMDIKAKSLKHKEPKTIEDNEDERNDELQLISVFDACKIAVERNLYGNIKPFIKHLKFSKITLHELSMYAKLWPSIVPVAGLWKTLYGLCKEDKPDWLLSESQEVLNKTLYEVILRTTNAVRTIHCEYYLPIVNELVNQFQNQLPKDTELKIVYASLLSMKCEYNLTEASNKYGWKANDPNADPELSNFNRTLPVEHEAMLPALKAVQLWTEVAKDLDNVPTSPIVSYSLSLASVIVQELLHCRQTAPAMQLAYICCKIAEKLEDERTLLQNLSVLLYHVRKPNAEISELINKHTEYSMQDDLLDIKIQFICDVALYHSRCGHLGLAAKLLQIAQTRILAAMQNTPDMNLDLSIGRLMFVQSQMTNAGQSILTHVNALQRHYLAAGNNESTWSHRRLRTLSIKHHTCQSAVATCRLLRALGNWSRVRAALHSVVNLCSAVHGASVVKCVVNVWQGDDAQVKIDNRLKHILGLLPSNETQQTAAPQIKQQFFTPKQNNLETMLDNMMFKKTQTSPSLPCVSVPGFKRPQFLTHRKICDCYACTNPYSFVLACAISGLEAAVYSRAKEFDIAKNYFDGALSMFGLAEIKINDVFDNYYDRYDKFVVDIVQNEVENELRVTQIEALMEASYFELATSNFLKADDYVVTIHEIMQESTLDGYLKTEIMNLMIVSAQLRNITVKPDLLDLEIDMENLKLTPTKDSVDPPKTPEIKASKPPIIKDKIVIKDEEIPKLKRKVIKLNLDDEGNETPENAKPKPSTRTRSVFKIPIPVTSKPIPETIPNSTPKTSTSRVKILLTQPTQDLDTPQPKAEVKQEFFTPIETPNEKFFTPMTSLKTYTKKSLRQNIVKNLENEFSTPKSDVEKPDEEISKSRRTKLLESKRTLKRVTSPGKLGKDEKKTQTTRPRRIQRTNVNFSVDENN